MRWLCAQDIAAGRGFVYFDLHGDATPFLMRRVALEEKKKHCDLSNRLIVIDPGDTERSVGMNILDAAKGVGHANNERDGQRASDNSPPDEPPPLAFVSENIVHRQNRGSYKGTGNSIVV